MKKVVTERPRMGHARSYNEVRTRENTVNDMEDLPYHRSMRAPYDSWDGRKEFSDLLGPLHRFLQSRIGQPWDDVFSEICKNLPTTSTTTQHIRDHVRTYIETNVHMKDGIPYRAGKNYPLYGNLYNHPETGILSKAPDYETKKRELPDNWYHFGPELDAFKMNGIWYWAVYDTVKENCVGVTNAIQRDRNGEIHYFNSFRMSTVVYVSPGQRYISGRKQINSNDLKKYNLKNEQ